MAKVYTDQILVEFIVSGRDWCMGGEKRRCPYYFKCLIEQEFVWDESGKLHSLKDNDPVIIPLNKDNPVLGYLDPPHEPDDRAPRLAISFMVDENRWLCVTVRDLRTNRFLKRRTPVLRLK